MKKRPLQNSVIESRTSIELSIAENYSYTAFLFEVDIMQRMRGLEIFTDIGIFVIDKDGRGELALMTQGAAAAKLKGYFK